MEKLAAERQLDLTAARGLVALAQATTIIDPDTAIGNTVLDYLNAGRSLDEALEEARRQLAEVLRERPS